MCVYFYIHSKYIHIALYNITLAKKNSLLFFSSFCLFGKPYCMETLWPETFELNTLAPCFQFWNIMKGNFLSDTHQNYITIKRSTTIKKMSVLIICPMSRDKSHITGPMDVKKVSLLN